jgi:hypothetical protein
LLREFKEISSEQLLTELDSIFAAMKISNKGEINVEERS